MITDEEAWQSVPFNHKWVFNKLTIAQLSGINANLREIPVPKESTYIIRPIYNLSGMGLGAKEVYLIPESTERKTPLGFFWSEKIEGTHLSVDYKGIKPILTVKGTYSTLNYWDKWERVDNSLAPKLPKWLEDVSVYYPVVNVEYIDGRAIEVHLRANPDFKDNNYKEMIPVWDGDKKIKDGYIFCEDKESVLDKTRLGFLCK